MLVPIFTLKLNHKVVPRTVTVGLYDGIHPSLTCATSADKVLIHSPHTQQPDGVSGLGSDISLLNINQQITSLVAGRLDPGIPGDLLVVGTPTNVLAYDIVTNRDLFYKDSPDGANAIAIGMLGSIEKPLAIVGGNCSLQGYNKDGDDNFWTVTGDNVQSLCLLDFTNNGQNELIVGSEDFDIRVFQEDEIISEMMETDVITALCPLKGSQFGYGLTNGTVGVYDRSTRNWRIKSKNRATSIFGYDLDNDGVPELIIGWNNGKVDARDDRTGEIIFKANFNHGIAGIVEADYSMDSNAAGSQLLCVSIEGEVRGFSPATGGPGSSLFDSNVEQDTIRELSQRKQNLMLELKNYAENSKLAMSEASVGTEGGRSGPGNFGNLPFPSLKEMQPSGSSSGFDTSGGSGGDGPSMGGPASHIGLTNRAGGLSQSGSVQNYTLGVGMNEINKSSMGVIPANTQLHTTLSVNPGDQTTQPHIELLISTTNETIIRTVLIFAEGIFDGESHVAHPNGQLVSTSMKVTIVPPKDIPVDLHIKCLIGQRNSMQYHVFELTRQLPRFAMYNKISNDTPDSRSYVHFNLTERPQRMVMWINQNFFLQDDIVCDGDVKVTFSCLRSRGTLILRMSMHGQVAIHTDDMELAGDIIQSLAQFLNIDDLQTVADFPDELEKLRQILVKVDELHRIRGKLTAEMADHSNIIRSMVVRAEDSRIMGDMKRMRKGYVELYDLNRELVAGYNIRCNNHQELVACLKQVNQIIQKAGHLRVGKFKSQVISSCRTAIKTNNTLSLFKIIQTGLA